MWKLIEDSEMISELKECQIIATVQDDRFEKFQIKNIHFNGYISALHADGKVEVKVMPENNLLMHWRVKVDPLL
jgi:hypothetical protein